jgi:hypothetical protein
MQVGTITWEYTLTLRQTMRYIVAASAHWSSALQLLDKDTGKFDLSSLVEFMVAATPAQSVYEINRSLVWR